jgi:[ribosomal protein S5]-alanine N-acetyltransferase
MNYLLAGEESSRLLFRRLEISDYQAWLPFFKDPLWSKYWIMKKQTPEEQCDQWFKKIFNRYDNNLGGMIVLIDKYSGEFIGQCGLLLQTVDGIEELEIAYSIMAQHRGKGYAPEAAKKCIDVAFANQWKDSLISIIHEDNVESQQVAIKNKLIVSKNTIFDNNPVRIYRIEASHK